VKKLLRDLWKREETKIVLVLAVALVLSAIFFGWGTGEYPYRSGGGKSGERPSGMILIGSFWQGGEDERSQNNFLQKSLLAIASGDWSLLS